MFRTQSKDVYVSLHTFFIVVCAHMLVCAYACVCIYVSMYVSLHTFFIVVCAHMLVCIYVSMTARAHKNGRLE